MIAPRRPEGAASGGAPRTFFSARCVHGGGYDARAWRDLDAGRCEAAAAGARLFQEHGDLRAALDAGLTVVADAPTFACFDSEGRFDRLVCRLRLNRPGASPFLLQIDFYRGARLVASAHQRGALVTGSRTRSSPGD